MTEMPLLRKDLLQCDLYMCLLSSLVFPSGSVVKNTPASAQDAGSIPGSGRSPGEKMTAHSSIVAWIIPRTEEPGGRQSMGLQRVGHN